MSEITEQNKIEAESNYLGFFDGNNKYKERIQNMIINDKIRLVIDINDLRKIPNHRVEKLLNNSFVELTALQTVLRRCIDNINPDYGKSHEEFFLGFEGSFGVRHVNPRTLTSDFLGNMVCIEGVVTKTSTIKQKVNRSVHYCPNTGKMLERRYTDMTSNDPFPSSGAYPTKDEEGNLLETQFGFSAYKDHQTIIVQEMPETTPAGQMPRSVEIVLENDLVDSCKAGDRIYVTGQYRCLPGKRNGVTSTMFRTILIGNNICSILQQKKTRIEDKDFQMIRKISRRQDILDLLSRSIAPSIFGHEFIKRAILCQLLGGVERQLLNGTRIRGDINVLLLGDPSVAKSQFLRYVLLCARDRAIATTGRGSSGVGLTAAVATDKETGDKTLEAGAMVLADRGIICIDEFDKMSDIDRTAIHEVMEQGRVTIAKAGIHAKLNARCAVLAAANPVYGIYDQYKTPMENIGMQDSLLSRFDLLFIVLDQRDEEADRAIAEFVLKIMRYRSPGEEDGAAMPLQEERRVDYIVANDDGDDEIGHKKSDLKDEIFEEVHQQKGRVRGAARKEEVLTKKFLEKYIMLARELQPKLSREASSVLMDKYIELRCQEQDIAAQEGGAGHKHRTQPVTVRTLETMIRLATAHAKARLKKTISVTDAEAAADLVSYVLFKEVLQKKVRKRGAAEEDDSDAEDDETERKRTRIIPDNVDVERTEPVAPEAAPRTVELNAADMNKITKLLRQVFDEIRPVDSLTLADVIGRIVTRDPTVLEAQVQACLQRMNDDNRLMLTNTEVFIL